MSIHWPKVFRVSQCLWQSFNFQLQVLYLSLLIDTISQLKSAYNTNSVALMPPLTLPPELFSLIASFISLRSAPPTLLSLALGNRLFHSIVRPILYTRLILRNENDAVAVIQRILREPQLGLGVTELYVMSEVERVRSNSNVRHSGVTDVMYCRST
jgi:hypothetical protein